MWHFIGYCILALFLFGLVLEILDKFTERQLVGLICWPLVAAAFIGVWL